MTTDVKNPDHLVRWAPYADSPPRWLYLTGAYVDALDLQEQPVKLSRNVGTVCMPDNGCLPAPSSPIDTGVVLDKHAYLRDGTGYTLWKVAR